MCALFVRDPRPDNDESFREVTRRLATWQDIVELVAPLGVDRSRGWAATPVGEACWKLVGFHVTIGIRELTPLVLDRNGTYLPGKRVHWFYPGAPDSHTREAEPAYHARAFSAETKGPPDNDGAHFVIGGEHSVAPGAPGPDWIWVAAEPGGPRFSDAVHGLGMRVNTNHLIVSPIFQHVIKTGTEEEAGEEEETGQGATEAPGGEDGSEAPGGGEPEERPAPGAAPAAAHKIGLDGNRPVLPDGRPAPRLTRPELIADSGAAWVRLNFVLGPWNSPADPTRHSGRTWAELYHHIIDLLRDKGLQVYGLISNEAVRPVDMGHILRAPRDASPDRAQAEQWIDTYVDNFEAIVSEFQGKVSIFESYNEPDDWHGAKGDWPHPNWVHPSWFALMLDRIYRRVKLEVGLPGLTLVSGPLQGLDQNNNAGAEYLRRTYEYGRQHLGWGREGQPYPFDGVGYHLYVHEDVAPDWAGQEARVRATYKAYLDRVQQVIRAFEGQDSRKQLYISEMGWFSHDNNQAAREFQAKNVRLGLDLLAQNPAVALAIWFCAEDFDPPAKTYGLYEQGSLNPKPALTVFQQVCAELKAAEEARRKEEEKAPDLEPVANQHIITAFSRVQQQADPDPDKLWDVMQRKAGLKLADLAVPRERRDLPYTGPKVAEMTGLSEQERAWLREALTDLVGPARAGQVFGVSPVVGEPAFLHGRLDLANLALPPVTPLTRDASFGPPAGLAGRYHQTALNIWNRYGGLLQALAANLNLELTAAAAVAAVGLMEQPFGLDGRLTIRFKNQTFFELWGRDNPDRFRSCFMLDPDRPWLQQQWRPREGEPWRTLGGDQAEEWAAFDFARGLDDRAAHLSIAMGAPQLMGFSHDLLGYASAEEMFAAFTAGEQAQIAGLFDLIAGPTAAARPLQLLQAGNLPAFAALFAGPPQAAPTAAALAQAYRAMQKLGPIGR